MNILFLSKDNIGRSQIAEAWFNYLSQVYKKDHKAFSAATEMVGAPQTLTSMLDVTKNIIQVLHEDTIDLSEAIRKPLTSRLLQENNIEKIILMSTELFPENVAKDPRLTRWDIRDPKEKSIDEVRTIKDQIRNKVVELWKEIDTFEAVKKTAEEIPKVIDK